MQYKAFNKHLNMDFYREEWVSRKIFEHDFGEEPDILHVVSNHIVEGDDDHVYQRRPNRRPNMNPGIGVYRGNKIDRSMERHLKNILQYLR